MLWFSLLVLIPLAAVVVTAAGGGWERLRRHASPTRRPLAALELTVVTVARWSPLVNMVMGTLIAWVLVRDRFSGKRVLEVVIDIPFALPTIVAGLVLLSLYGPNSPLGVDVANTRTAVFLALAFVTLPFVVRTVQPVLEELERRRRGGRGVARRQPVHDLPADHPAQPGPGDRRRRRAVVRPRRSASTARWCCCRGNLPNRTEVASVRILTYIENGNPAVGRRGRDGPAGRRAGRRSSPST